MDNNSFSRSSSTSLEPLLVRSSFSVEETLSTQALLRHRLEKKKRRKWKRTLLFRHHRGHWEEIIRGTFPILVAASVNMVVQQILDMIVGSRGISFQLIVNFIYACGIAHTLGYLVAYYVPIDNPAAEYYASLASDNAAFAWSSFLTLVIMNWVYSDYPIYAAILAWICLVFFVILFIYGSNYVQTAIWVTDISIRRRLRDFESDCFALAIAYSFTVILAASCYHDSATDYLSNTDDMDSNVPDPVTDDKDNQLHNTYAWIFFVYTSCITLLLVAYQWKLNKYIHRKTVQRQRELLWAQESNLTNSSPSLSPSTVVNATTTRQKSSTQNSPSRVSTTPYNFVTQAVSPSHTTMSPLPATVPSYNIQSHEPHNESAHSTADVKEGEMHEDDIHEIESLLSSTSSNSSSSSDEDEEVKFDNDNNENQAPIPNNVDSGDKTDMWFLQQRYRRYKPITYHWRKRCLQLLLPWDVPYRHCALAYKRCFYTSIAYLIASAWHIWCQLSFVKMFSSIPNLPSVLIYMLFALLVTFSVAWCLTLVTWHKEWTGLRSLPMDHLQFWFSSSTTATNNNPNASSADVPPQPPQAPPLSTSGYITSWQEMESILYITCGRLSVGWAWNTVFSVLISTVLIPQHHTLPNNGLRAGLLLLVRLCVVVGMIYGGYVVEMMFYRQRMIALMKENEASAASSGNGRSSGSRGDRRHGHMNRGLIMGDSDHPARQLSTNMRL